MSAVIPPMSGHWIKLYTEILNSRIYSSLAPNLFELAIKLKLVMGMTPKDHVLPPLEDIGFKIRRTNADVLLKDMEELQKCGILDHDGKNWIFPNVVEEGEPDSPKARQARHREKERLSRSGNDPVTNRDLERLEEDMKEQDQSREERKDETQDLASTSALVGEVMMNCVVPDADKTDEAFWERMRELRPDLNIPKQIEKMKAYCQKTGKTLSRRFVEEWIKRESPQVKAPSKTSSKHKVDERDAFEWRCRTYHESRAFHPTPESYPFSTWPKSTQDEYQVYKKSPKNGLDTP